MVGRGVEVLNGIRGKGIVECGRSMRALERVQSQRTKPLARPETPS